MPLPARVKGSIQLNAVSFSYREGPAILEGLNLQIRGGEKIALVGVSGSGKSTIAKLIARLYDVSRGAVRLDGIDVRNIQLESLRTKVSYLIQDAVLFDRTLRENLLFGNPSATDKELTEAIEITGLTELLRRLPNGWHTPIGPRGNLLSGGERQRLALARALLQKPSLILLDESTSALDLPSERKILANLTHHFRNGTIVFISHRISALRWVDRIVVLDRGLIQDQGTHEQLTQRGGLYAQLSSIVASSEPLDRIAACQAASPPRLRS